MSSNEMETFFGSRRQWLSTHVTLALAGWVWAQPAGASTGELNATLKAHAGAAVIQEGRVKLDIAPIVDNGNTVPVRITVQSPMTYDNYVTDIALFNERNPEREIAKFVLSPRSGSASIATRIRLATTQKLVAVARMNDGSYWSHTVDVIVSIAACIED
jgi:sulfur-oxidizing protein SoxY